MKTRQSFKHSAFILFTTLLLASTLACSLVDQLLTSPTPVPPAPTTSPVEPAQPAPSNTPESSPVPAASPGTIAYNNPRRYRVEFTATVRNTGFALTELQVYQPRPIDWEEQRQVVMESISPESTRLGTDPTYGNGIAFWDLKRNFPSIGKPVDFSMIFTFTAYETNAQVNPNGILPYNTGSALYKLYTRHEQFIESTDPQIVALADQLAAGEENPFILAHKFYNYVVENISYRLINDFWGAKGLLNKGYGECGDYSALFIALARAKGIPARPVVGYWAFTGTDQTHVWAEFYLEGLGWVPADPTIGQQSSSNKLYYFGNMDNQRVILEKGFNIPMDPAAPDNWTAALMQGPNWWYWGDGNGALMSIEVTRWNVTTLP